ncbi:MAG: MBL fold metallo-hydrolase [Cytophagaceae bacterium]|jgi:glyoxylase-like metal-dependent hydrolase (beta-lactamase superfamily II)|nr:MBL fold metallo-hydrolase [Cytophagaceae bacterium]
MIVKAFNLGSFKLDGGAMFGVVPKSIWTRYNTADEHNLCTWASRCIFISCENKNIIIDTGLGNKQSEAFFKHYHRTNTRTWEDVLSEMSLTPDDITDVIMTHLHFDHVGGATIKKGDGRISTTFPKATYWTHSGQWNWAIQPNDREKASFLEENILPIQQSGQLKFWDIDLPQWSFLEMITVDGHTEKQLLPLIKTPTKKYLFAADLIPSHGHIPIPYVMSYDVRPLLTMDEKKSILQMAVDLDWIIIFEHDPHVECCTLIHTEKGVRAHHFFTLAETLL